MNKLQEIYNKRDITTQQLRNYKRQSELNTTRKFLTEEDNIKHLVNIKLIIQQEQTPDITDNNQIQYTEEHIPLLCQQLSSQHLNEVQSSVTGLRSLITQNQYLIDICVLYGCIPPLIKLMKITDSPKLQLESTQCLVNITTSELFYAQLLIKANIIESLLCILKSDKIEVCIQGLYLVSNLVYQQPTIRDILLQHNIISYTTKILQSSDKDNKLNNLGLWIFSNIINTSPIPDFNNYQFIQIIPFLGHVLTSEQSINIILDLLLILEQLTNNSISQICDHIIQHGIIQYLIQNLTNDIYQQELIPNIIRILNNILQCSNEYCIIMVNNGIIEQFYDLLQNIFILDTVKIEILQIFQNLLSCEDDVSHIIINKKELLRLLINNVSSSQNQIQIEALYCLNYIIKKSSEFVIRILLELGCIQSLNESLEQKNEETLIIAMECIYLLIINSQGIQKQILIEMENVNLFSKIQDLCDHQSYNICQIAGNILEEYSQI